MYCIKLFKYFCIIFACFDVSLLIINSFRLPCLVFLIISIGLRNQFLLFPLLPFILWVYFAFFVLFFGCCFVFDEVFRSLSCCCFCFCFSRRSFVIHGCKAIILTYMALAGLREHFGVSFFIIIQLRMISNVPLDFFLDPGVI